MSQIPGKIEFGGAEYSHAATELDIFYCFRLLLGRNPGQREWPGHSWRVGEDLSVVVGSYLNSQEFAGRHLMARELGQWQLVELPLFRIYASAEDSFAGKVIVETGDYEPNVGRAFKRHLHPGMRVLDIGANIGYFSMLAAALVGPTGAVYSWEPAPSNVRVLYANQLVNRFENVVIMQAAAAEKTGLLKYFHTLSNGNVAEMNETRFEDLLAAETVMGVRVDDFVPGNVNLDLLKIDVEGYEFRALCGARETIARSKPVIVTEFSPGSLLNASGVSGREYLEFLARMGYRLAVLTDEGAVKGSVDKVLERFERSGTDHIDIVAEAR